MVSFPGFSQDKVDGLIKKYCADVEKKHGRNVINSRLVLPHDAQFVFEKHKRCNNGTLQLQMLIFVFSCTCKAFIRVKVGTVRYKDCFIL